MRGCAAALLILLAAPAVPQCTLTPVASAQFRSTIFDLAAENGRLWAATGYGLTLYDSTVDPPRALDSIAHAGATVNDLALTANDLYAATANGIVQFDLLDPSAPAKTSVTFAISGAGVTSLALAGNTIYAADGHASIEVFKVAAGSAPQRAGSFTSILPRPSAVSASDGRVYVSNGLQTEILVGSDANVSGVATSAFPFGSSSFAPLTTNAIFVAGSDRRLRAFDVSSAAAPVEIFRTELAPTSGTVNRINAVVVSNGHLYAGAGDIGLLTYDVRQFASPFPLRDYTAAATNSVATSVTQAWFARATGLVEYAISPFGALTEARS